MLNINTDDEKEINTFFKTLLHTGYDSESLYFRWKVGLTKEQFEKTVSKNILVRYAANPNFILTKDESGSFVSKVIPIEGIGTLKNMYVSRRGADGNVMKLVIEGSIEAVQPNICEKLTFKSFKSLIKKAVALSNKVDATDDELQKVAKKILT